MSSGFDVVVIGSGVNSLAAAALLGRAGRRVVVLERNPEPGGQGALLEFSPGFRASPLGDDSGWLPPPVAAALGLEAPARVIPAEPLAVALPDGGRLALAADPARAAEALRGHSARDAGRWEEFTTMLARQSGFLEALYVLPAPDIGTSALGELLPLAGVARRFRGLGRRGMVELLRTVPMSVQELVDDWFECEPLKAAVAARGVAGICQGPRSGGTGFVLLHHLVGAPAGVLSGRGYWREGPDALARAVREAAVKAGVVIRTGAEVEQVRVREERVTGVALRGGEEVSAPSVVSGADPVRTLTGMMDPVWLDPEFLLAVRNIKLRGSTARVLYAMDRLPEGLAGLTGTLTLSATCDDIERSHDDAKYGRVSARPHVTLEVPSLRWEGMAPAGRHVVRAEVRSAPYRRREGGSDPDARRAVERAATARIEEAVPGFSGAVRHAEVLTPADLEARYGLTEGAESHGELTLDQILFMRPVAGWARHAMPVGGLYLCGAGTHPGPGIPGGPGWLAAQRLLADRR